MEVGVKKKKKKSLFSKTSGKKKGMQKKSRRGGRMGTVFQSALGKKKKPNCQLPERLNQGKKLV